MYGKTQQSNPIKRFQILLRKREKEFRKIMDEQDANICKRALIQGQSTCGGGDLLPECITWWKKFNIRCVTKGTNPIPEMEQADNLKLKRGVWKENYKEIGAELDEQKKVKYIDMPTTKRERNYLR